MKIGKWEFKEYSAHKPVCLSPAGDFVTVQELLANPELRLGSLFTLNRDLQLKLALERYRLEPEFRLGIMGTGILTKKEIVSHLRRQTELGKRILKAELGYCNELMSSLPPDHVPLWPVLPVPPELKSGAEKRRRSTFQKKPCISVEIPTRVLFCENTTDEVTAPLAQYRIAHVHPLFKECGFTPIVLKGTDDIRSLFTPEAKRSLTVYISGVGHGNYTLYSGHWGDILLEVGCYDPAEVQGKSIHFLSCRTGRQLGSDAVEAGADSYLGYNENYILQWDDGSTPAVDEFELFARSDSIYDLMMACGGTAKRALDATLQAYNAAIAEVPNQVAATYLTWDRDHLALHGKASARIGPQKSVRLCFPLENIAKENALVEAGEMMD